MSTRKGTCTNYGNCSIADKREEVVDSGDFLCPECGHSLHEVVPVRKGPPKSFIFGGVAVLVVTAAIVAYLMPERGSGPPPPGPDKPTTFTECNLRPTPEPDVLRLIEYQKQGMNYASRKQFDQALAEFKQALTIDPNFLAARQNAGSALLALRKYSEAEGEFNQELKLDGCLEKLTDIEVPKFAYMIEVGAASKPEQDSNRVKVYRERLRQTEASAHYNLAALHSAQNKVDESLEELRAAIRLGFDDRQALNTDPDLKNVRQNPAFKKVLAALR